MLARWMATVALVLALSSGAVAEGQRVEVLRLPAGGIQPRVQVDDKGVAHLIYFKGDPRQGDVFYIQSHDWGRQWSEPLRVNNQPGSVMAIGTIRGAHLALGREGRVHVAWMASEVASPEPEFGAVLYTRLNDAGDGFELPHKVADHVRFLDGGGSVAADGQGHVYVVWHAPVAGGKTEADRRVWIARSSDGGKTFDPPHAVFGEGAGACGCCGMDIFAASTGHVFIVYRSAREMVHRDVHVLVSKDHGRTFEVAAIDPWEIGACIMSTSALAQAGEQVLAVWETKEQIRLARFTLDGEPAGESQSMPGPGKGRKHPAVAVNGQGEFVVAWTEGTGWNKGGTIVWQKFDRDGRPILGQTGRAEGLPAWGSPAVFVRSDGLFALMF